MDLAHQQFVRADQANDGHAAITRPVAVRSATATFAARLATLQRNVIAGAGIQGPKSHQQLIIADRLEATGKLPMTIGP